MGALGAPMLAEIALHAKDLIADGWAHGYPSRFDAGRRSERCAVIAIAEATFEQGLEKFEVPANTLFKEVIGVPCTLDIGNWNDHPSRTKQDVLDAFDEMARLAKERGL